MATITFKIKLAWWLKPYVYGFAFVSAITGLEPDWTRVKRWIDKGVRADYSDE